MKKLPKVGRDNWGPILLVIQDSQRAAWKASAERAGMTITEWVIDRLSRIAR